MMRIALTRKTPSGAHARSPWCRPGPCRCAHPGPRTQACGEGIESVPIPGSPDGCRLAAVHGLWPFHWLPGRPRQLRQG